MTGERAALGPPPAAPGALGRTLESSQILDYLERLSAWRSQLRAALDALDLQARAVGGEQSALVADLTLAYALWQAIAGRLDELVAKWDSGRVGRHEREEISTLVWSRVDASTGGLPVSIAEACVLADALVARLTARLEAAQLGSGGQAHAAAIRASLVRSRAQAAELGVPTEADAIEADLDRVLARAASPAAVQAELARVDAAASTLERDLIISAATKAGVSREHAHLCRRLDAAAARSREVRRSAVTCSERVSRPPTLGIPDPGQLGPVPAPTADLAATRKALDAYAARLSRVEAALAVAAERFTAPLEELAELRGLVAAYAAKAAAHGYAADAALRDEHDRAVALLDMRPCDLAAARTAVASYRREVDSRKDGRAARRPATSDPKGGSS